MKKISALILAALMLFTFAACGGAGEGATEPATENSTTQAPTAEGTYGGLSKSDYDSMTAEDLIGRFADRLNPTLDEYVQLIETYAFATVKNTTDFEDNITDEALSALKKEKANLPKLADVFPVIVKSTSPNVRGYAYKELRTNFFDTDTAVYSLIQELYPGETDSFVITCIIRGAVNTLRNDQAFADYIVANSDGDEYRKVYVAEAMGIVEPEDRSKLADVAVKYMEDESETVRKKVYATCGKLGDERVIDGLVAVLNDDAAYKLHGAAMDGLAGLWYDYPEHENTSEKAYRATIDYFTKPSDDEHVPYWDAINAFNVTGGKVIYDAWREKATYFDEAELVEAMLGITKDTSNEKLSRAGAIQVIGKFGTDEDMAAVKAVIDAEPDEGIKSAMQSKYDFAVK